MKAYKVLDSNPSIYLEIQTLDSYFQLELYLDSNLVSSVTTKSSNYNFNIKGRGSYSVVLKYNGSEAERSDMITFYETDFELKPVSINKKQAKINFNEINERLIHNVQGFYIEIKTIKGMEMILKNALVPIVRKENILKKIINLESFDDQHSIHNYEYYEIHDGLDQVKGSEICKIAEGLEGVIYCSVIPLTENLLSLDNNTFEKSKVAISNRSIKSADFSNNQNYLDEFKGMNIRNVWKKGYSGDSAVVRHLDYGIYKNHEDFQAGNIIVVNSRDETHDCNHGTASTGCIAASNNGSGVIGIAHSSQFFFYDTGDLERILQDVKRGDIVSIDSQFEVDKKLLPLIYSKGVWDTIKNMTEKGAVVIMAAGNGGLDLSNPSILPDYGDSGAILVGACQSSNGRRHGFSNYGHYTSLINSWGDSVTTTGYGSLQDYPGHDRDYTKDYSGTSSATPLCAGALALLQSYAKKMGIILTSKSMKDLLNESNYIEGVADRIGRRPNVEQLIGVLDKNILYPIASKNPYTTSSSYSNYNASFKLGLSGELKINFDYRNTDLITLGVVAYYEAEGPTALEWFSFGHTILKVPVSDNNGAIHVIYLRASKNIYDQASLTMNSAAYYDIGKEKEGNFDLVLKFLPEDNKYLNKGSYKGILPLYLKAWQAHQSSFVRPLIVNIFID